MSELNELAATFERKSAFWSKAYTITIWIIAFHALLFGLYLFTSVKGAFTLVYGTTAANVWYSVGVALVLTLAMSTAYSRAHGFKELAARARGEG